MQKLTSEQKFNEIINQKQLTIAVFTATWCVDCRYIEPFMPQLVERYKDRITFVEIDRDEHQELAIQLNVLGIPSFIAFHNGQEITRFVSKLRKTEAEIEHFFTRTLLVAEALS